MDTLLKRTIQLTTVAVCLVLVVVLLGGWTRLNDAGLGCPDWPGCYGEMVLPGSGAALQEAQARFPDQLIDQKKGWLEMIHRYAAGSLGILIAVLTWLGWRQRFRTGYPLMLSFGLLVLVTVQAAFGMWTVTLKLLPQVVTLHLLGGLLTLSLLVRLRQRLVSLREWTSTNVDRKPQRWVLIGLLILFMQLALGGWTSANYAGWACTDWLQCNTDAEVGLDFGRGFELMPEVGPNYEGGQLPVEARAAIQVTHRVMAVLLLAYLFWLCWKLRFGSVGAVAQVVVVIALIQLGLGVANIIWALPLSLATAHHAGAVALLLSLLWLYERSGTYPQEVRDESA